MTGNRRLLAALLAVPTILAVLGLVAVESWRLSQPRSPLFAAPLAASLADAIETGDLLQAYRFLRDGQEPSALITARHPVLTGGQTVLVSPLLWAVATENREVVQMLVGLGVRTDRRADREAACLAHALGNDGVADLLRTYRTPPDEICSSLGSGGPPLLAFIANEN